MSSGTIWVIDDDRTIRWVLERTFREAGFQVECFEESQPALTRLEQPQSPPPDVIFSDIRMPGMDGLTFLSRIKMVHPDLPVIIMTAHSDLDSAVSSYQTGAFEYLPKPFDIDEALHQAQRALQQAQQQRQHSSGRSERTLRMPDLIGESPAMQEVFRAIGRLAQSHITVLINGESGTGKELVAQALHRHSPRASRPFIALNMAAIPRDLIESELFGHEKGAFTGATTQRQGRFEQATEGTLFLDEIGDMPFETQTRLLRVLADGEFYRVGGHVPVRVNVRIVAATHQDLEKLVQQGKFREDLFHRLNVIRIQLPPLRERPEDIPMLTRHFLQQAARELGTDVKRLRPDTMTFIQSLPWSGNIRQLQNTCRWITVMASGHEVFITDLPPELRTTGSATPLEPQVLPVSTKAVEDSGELPPTPISVTATSALNPDRWSELVRLWADQKLRDGEVQILDKAQFELEKVLLEAALEYTNGKKRLAAELLGWGRNTLTRKLKELGFQNHDLEED